MESHSRARKIGGKGTPRLPPKRTSQSQQILLQGILSSYKTTLINHDMAILNADKNYIFQKQKLQNISICKNSNAYILSGKCVEQQLDLPRDFEEAAEILNDVDEDNKDINGIQNGEDATNTSVADKEYEKSKSDTVEEDVTKKEAEINKCKDEKDRNLENDSEKVVNK